MASSSFMLLNLASWMTATSSFFGEASLSGRRSVNFGIGAAAALRGSGDFEAPIWQANLSTLASIGAKISLVDSSAEFDHWTTS